MDDKLKTLEEIKKGKEVGEEYIDFWLALYSGYHTYISNGICYICEPIMPPSKDYFDWNFIGEILQKGEIDFENLGLKNGKNLFRVSYSQVIYCCVEHDDLLIAIKKLIIIINYEELKRKYNENGLSKKENKNE